jgi:histidine triad (HIT) family protein
MKDSNCIFCKIVEGSVPSYKIYEDAKYIAFLDVFPTAEGQTLVIPKNHTDSSFINVSDGELADFIVVVKKVAKILREKLKKGRINLVFEGVDVNHLHAKLYPDYVVTSGGAKASDSALRELQKRLVQ